MRAVFIILVAGLIASGVFAYNNHVVATIAGLRVYTKIVSGFDQTYVDVRPLDVCHLGPYKNVVIAMVAAGDHGLITGGEHIKMAMDASQVVSSNNDRVFRTIDMACGLSKSAANVAQRLRENPTVNRLIDATGRKLGDIADKFRGQR